MNITTHNMTSLRHHEHGLTLIETMIALTISMLLMAGVLQIFISSKASYNLQNGLGRLQENGRYAMDVLSRNIGMAGFYINSANSAAVQYPIIEANTADNATPNADLGFTVANGQASDNIEITYVSATDCLGNATGGVAIDRYYISGTDLMCLGNGSNTPQILAEGVENMQILYGDDANQDGIADSYVSAGNITGAEWLNVKSVRIALLVDTVDSVGGSDTGVYALLNAPPIGPINDNLARKVFTRTILLRNKVS